MRACARPACRRNVCFYNETTASGRTIKGASNVQRFEEPAESRSSTEVRLIARIRIVASSSIVSYTLVCRCGLRECIENYRKFARLYRVCCMEYLEISSALRAGTTVMIILRNFTLFYISSTVKITVYKKYYNK